MSKQTPWQERTVEVTRQISTSSIQKYQLSCKIFNPHLLDTSVSSLSGAPLVVIHGGPGLPSDYLLPLADNDTFSNRAILFYDQLGCGLSSAPNDIAAYSVHLSINDLEVIISTLLGSHKFHLYGHSYGGMLAYEYLRLMAERSQTEDEDDSTFAVSPNQCLSVILSSTPTSISESDKSQNDIMMELLAQDPSKITLDERFRLRCQCRTPAVPEPLLNAFRKAGKIWAGTDVVSEFECLQPSTTKRLSSSAKMPSVRIMRGEYDFITEDMMTLWRTGGFFNHHSVQETVFKGGSHFCLLEKGQEYRKVIESFLVENDLNKHEPRA
eukprot:CAMPEP_0195508010 /NCGR_PEP_ID=MMETSP0794_2-20130614/1329_1 /TAXON_ID=515487 /ORGANISM="Stephanopyxis turris, Strain CCMP 815" /LENGTH=324 /DNA_ID=CAMNT_0040634853 /DNA_START=177 /DNA_END=1151 /DNA_ORIENTATION=+